MDVKGEDIHLCGRCRQMFTDIDEYFDHKKQNDCQNKADRDALKNSLLSDSEMNHEHLISTSLDVVADALRSEVIESNAGLSSQSPTVKEQKFILTEQEPKRNDESPSKLIGSIVPLPNMGATTNEEPDCINITPFMNTRQPIVTKDGEKSKCVNVRPVEYSTIDAEGLSLSDDTLSNVMVESSTCGNIDNIGDGRMPALGESILDQFNLERNTDSNDSTKMPIVEGNASDEQFDGYSSYGQKDEELIGIINIKPKRKGRLIETIVLDNEDSSLDCDQGNIKLGGLAKTEKPTAAGLDTQGHDVQGHVGQGDNVTSEVVSCDEDVIITSEDKLFDDDMVKHLIELSGLNPEEFNVDDMNLEDVMDDVMEAEESANDQLQDPAAATQMLINEVIVSDPSAILDDTDFIEVVFEENSERLPQSPEVEPQKSVTEAKKLKKGRPLKILSETAEYVCPFCSKVSLGRGDFDRHLRVEHQHTGYVCPVCCKGFCDSASVIKHLMRRCKNGIPAFDITNIMQFVPLNFVKRSDQPANQPALSISPVSQSALSISPASKSKLSISPASQSASSIALASQSADSELAVIYPCLMCDEDFLNYDEIGRHVSKEHHGVLPGICEFCGKWFTVKHKLSRHLFSANHDKIPADLMTTARERLKTQRIRWNGKSVRKIHWEVPCDQCNKVFKTSYKLYQHKNNEHFVEDDEQAATHWCESCPSSFMSQYHYESHMLNVHQINEISYSMTHKKQKPVKTYYCRVCSYGFPAKKGLQIHLDRVHQARPIIPLDVIGEIEGQDYLHTINGEYEETPTMNITPPLHHKCFVCYKILANQAALYLHVQSHRSWIKDQKSDSTECVLPLTDEAEGRQLEGTHMEEKQMEGTYAEETQMDTNVMEWQAENTADNLQTSNMEDLEQETVADDLNTVGTEIELSITGLRLFPQYTLVCSYCLQKCDSLEGLYAHKTRLHSLKPAFVCLRAKCGKKFDKVADFRVHASTVHTQSPFICVMCNEHITDSKALKRHKTQLHGNCKSDMKWYTCTICSSIFPTASQLRKHRLSEHGHNCAKCNHHYKTEQLLNNHKCAANIHICDECGLLCETNTSLKLHEQSVHGDEYYLKCLYCEEKFTTFNQRQKHIEKEHRELHRKHKTHKCCYKDCTRTFESKPELRDHIRNHNPLKTFQCPHCEKCYESKSVLNLHVKKKHKNNK